MNRMIGIALAAAALQAVGDPREFVTPDYPRVKTGELHEVRRGKEWRPLKGFDGLHFRRANEPLRVPAYDIVPGTALDLSQRLPRYDIAAMGRIVANAEGDLVYEKHPDVKPRLRGFNFTLGDVEDNFDKLTHAQLEAYAEQIRLRGMNVIRLHFQDRSYVGLHGGARYTKAAERTKQQLGTLPQSLAELKVDRKYLDHMQYFFKCLRDRGIYLMPDIVTSTGMMSGIMNIRENVRYRLFHDEEYRNHWKACAELVLTTVNPYTGLAAKDDPQVLGICFCNEQEHLFFEGGKAINAFDPQWQAYRKAKGRTTSDPFAFKLLYAADEQGEDARAFLRGEIDAMNDFYVKTVRDLGYRGFVMNWDMFMRNLEGAARRNFDSVAIHTYCAHPGREKLLPAYSNHVQKLVYGPWFKGSMGHVSKISSISFNNYLAQAAVTRELGKPLFVTEISHGGLSAVAQEYPAMLGAYAALQGWQALVPHANLVEPYTRPATSGLFDGMPGVMGGVASLCTAFAWQRGDVRRAPHAISFAVPETTLAGPDYTSAIGSAWNSMFLLTRVGVDYNRAKNPVADLNWTPDGYVGTVSMGMWAAYREDISKGKARLAANVAALREKGWLGADNRTDAAKKVFQSETGEIVADLAKRTLTVDAPRFQAAVLKFPGDTADLSALRVTRVSRPVNVTAISLDETKPVAASRHLLVIVATRFAAEGSSWSDDEWREFEVDTGDMQTLMRAGEFEFSVRTGCTSAPKVYALNLNGTRECEIPVTCADGRLSFALDTSKLEYGTPYFEVVDPGVTTYFVDSEAGDDARDGLTEATAWRTLERANAAEMKPGDRMLFRRGGLWRGKLDLKSGTAEARTYYGAYGKGPKPVFQGSVERSRESDWTEIEPGLWSTATDKGTDVECVVPAEKLMDWHASYQEGVKGKAKVVTENGETFLRVACTERPKTASPNHLQIWGASMVGFTAPLRFRFLVRGDFLPKGADILLMRPPWRRPHVGGVEISDAADANGWREASVLFADDAAMVREGVLHINLGLEAVPGGKMDLKPVGVYRVRIGERARIGKDVGILILGDGAAWGVKKWTKEDLKADLDYWYDAGRDRVVMKLGRNPAKAYPSVELAKTMTVIPHARKHDVTVEAFTIRYTGGFAFSGGGAERITVKNCDMNFIGGGLQYWKPNPSGELYPVRYGNGIEYWSPARDCRVERCRFWQVYDAAVTPQQSGSTNGFDNIVYVDNVFWQCEYSFEYWNHDPASHSRNIVFEHNTSVDAGDCWSHAQRPNPNGAHLMSYVHVGEMSGQVIRNNVFCRSTDRGFRFFTDWRDTLAMDHNLHYEPSKTLSECHARAKDGKRGWRFGAGSEEFRRYQAETGLDAGSLYAEPQFVDPAKRDYRLKPGSPGTSLATDGGPVGARNMPGLDRDQSVQ